MRRPGATRIRAFRGAAPGRARMPAMLNLEDLAPERPPDRALLAVEVSGSSLRKDRHIKAPLYAESGVPEYWIVNLLKQVIEVHGDPRDGEYARSTKHRRGETLHPAGFPKIGVAVA